MRHVLLALCVLLVMGCTSIGGYQLVHESELRRLTGQVKPPLSPMEQIMEYQRAMTELKKIERLDTPDADRVEGAISQLRRDLQRILQGVYDALKDLDEALRRHDQKGRTGL